MQIKAEMQNIPIATQLLGNVINVLIRTSLKGSGNSFQYSCLENPMDRGAWWATVHRVAKSRTRLSDFTFTFTFSHVQEGWIGPGVIAAIPASCHAFSDKTLGVFSLHAEATRM